MEFNLFHFLTVEKSLNFIEGFIETIIEKRILLSLTGIDEIFGKGILGPLKQRFLKFFITIIIAITNII
jgi:hypothetical protein